MSVVELKNNLNLIKVLCIALIIVITFLLSITIYGMITRENKTTFVSLFAVGISCATILPYQFSSMKKIKKELASR